MVTRVTMKVFLCNTYHLFFFEILRLCASFNLDESFPTIHYGELKSLFGYSVAMHREGEENMLLVGAPKAQSLTRPEIVRGGLVYRCPAINSSDGCGRIVFDTKGHPSTRKGRQNGSKSNQMFGSTVQSAGPDSLVMACAPNFVKYFTSSNGNEDTYSPCGVCFVATNNFNQMYKYNPCQHGSTQQRGCQLGFSGLISMDSLFLGGPGSFYWQGQVFRQKYPVPENSWPMTSSRDSITFDDSYQGYSVAQGDLDGNGTIDYVTGAPNRHGLLGSVLVYSSSVSFENPMFEIIGHQVGSYFGHSVAVSDFNGDGLEDLVVSAPTFTDYTPAVPLFDIGRIYIYYQNETGSLRSKPVITQGFESNGRFGFTLVAMGDINLDGYNDLAVSAPYENNGEGAVYTFLGHPDGLRSKPSQVIKPPQSGRRPFRGFGFSMSGNFDIDQNNYTDLLIGAPHSSSVVLYKARQVMKLFLDIRFDVKGVMYKNRDLQLPDGSFVSGFNTTVCLRYSGINVREIGTFQCSVRADSLRQVNSRAFFIDNAGRQGDVLQTITQAQINHTHCMQYTTFLRRTLRDFQSIGITYRCSLDQETQTSAVPDRSRDTTETEQTEITRLLPVFTNCTNENCFPRLYLLAERKLGNETDDTALLVGATTHFNITITVGNEGDEAFQTKLYVILPQGIQFSGVTRNSDHVITCSTGNQENLIVCELDSPFEGGGNSMTFEMLLTSEGLDGNSEYVDIELEVRSSFQESGEERADNFVTVRIQVETKVDVVMYSDSIPSQYTLQITEGFIYTNYEHEIEAGSEVVHIFAVQNFGPSDIETAELTVWWPMYTIHGYLLYLMNVTLNTGEECHVNEELNPINLKIEPQAKVADFKLAVDMSDPFSHSNDHNNSNDTEMEEDYIDLPTNISRNRLKRSSSVTFDEYDEYEAKYKEIHCKEGMEECYVIKCPLNNIVGSGNRKVVTLQLRSRIWENTFNLLPGKEWRLSSNALLTVKSLPYRIQPKELPVVSARATIDVTEPVPLLSPRKAPPFWIIVVSVVGGIVILTLILGSLLKLGFFSRRKFRRLRNEDLKGPVDT
ncbi:Integrin alpha-8 [Holothuria leucospilota]|uniref:Integrin alpha-8 n=1 Tax=Holothuria leucospilota TaxID=206669 RepID=A0A9Q0YLH6_HOLLE|nr:Integrin alpha-8 [Holothuria leucospilota]